MRYLLKWYMTWIRYHAESIKSWTDYQIGNYEFGSNKLGFDNIIETNNKKTRGYIRTSRNLTIMLSCVEMFK